MPQRASLSRARRAKTEPCGVRIPINASTRSPLVFSQRTQVILWHPDGLPPRGCGHGSRDSSVNKPSKDFNEAYDNGDFKGYGLGRVLKPESIGFAAPSTDPYEHSPFRTRFGGRDGLRPQWMDTAKRGTECRAERTGLQSLCCMLPSHERTKHVLQFAIRPSPEQQPQVPWSC